MMQKALVPPSARGRHMLSCPPVTTTVSRPFLHEDDECWVALTSADDATEDLMKIEKNSAGRANCHQQVSHQRLGTLGERRRSRFGQSRRRRRQWWWSWRWPGQGEHRATDDANSPSPKAPTYQGFSLTTGSTSQNCSWSSSSGGASSGVTISRE